jgi:hypothetical protein
MRRSRKGNRGVEKVEYTRESAVVFRKETSYNLAFAFLEVDQKPYSYNSD